MPGVQLLRRRRHLQNHQLPEPELRLPEGKTRCFRQENNRSDPSSQVWFGPEANGAQQRFSLLTLVISSVNTRNKQHLLRLRDSFTCFSLLKT